MIIFISAALFITQGCEKSDYEKTLSGEDVTSLIEESNITTENNETGSTNPGETAGTDSGNGTTPETTEHSTTPDSTVADSTVIQVLIFAEKSLNLKPQSTFYAKLDTWSMELKINKETGEAAGFIFASYTEASMDGNSTVINTSVLKANLKGTVDMKTLDFKGRVTGNILADRDGFFSGSIDLETAGKVSASYSQFKGNFTTPSYLIFDYILENK
jgi:hypothetical protein